MLVHPAPAGRPIGGRKSPGVSTPSTHPASAYPPGSPSPLGSVEWTFRAAVDFAHERQSQTGLALLPNARPGAAATRRSTAAVQRGSVADPHPQVIRRCASQRYRGVPPRTLLGLRGGTPPPYPYLLLSVQPTPTEHACARTRQRRTARACCPVLRVACIFGGRVRRVQLRRVNACCTFAASTHSALWTALRLGGPRVLGSTPAGRPEGTREYSGWAARGYSGVRGCLG
jgi:hypothetical protein